MAAQYAGCGPFSPDVQFGSWFPLKWAWGTLPSEMLLALNSQSASESLSIWKYENGQVDSTSSYLSCEFLCALSLVWDIYPPKWPISFPKVSLAHATLGFRTFHCSIRGSETLGLEGALEMWFNPLLSAGSLHSDVLGPLCPILSFTFPLFIFDNWAI